VAFSGEVVPFPSLGGDAGGRELVEPWAGVGIGIDESVPLESPGAPTTSPRPTVSSARGVPWGAMLCDWLLFGVSGSAQPPAQPQQDTQAAAWTGMTAGRSPNKVDPPRSATTGQVWDERRQRFVTPKAVVQASAAAAAVAAGLSDHLGDHLKKCRLEQEIGELFRYLFPDSRRAASRILTSHCFVMLGGSGPQGIGEHIATHKENVARRAAT
jgi:hypothetical protein